MSKKLYVGNLDYATTESSLSDLFSQVGEVLSVNLVTDRMTGRSRGFAFVEMVEASDAQRAIAELDGKTLGQRQIKVAEARPQKPRGQRDSYGGGGRRRY